MEKKTIYTNGINIGVQAFDFLLSMNVIHPDGFQDVEYRVFMSPQHAKALLNTLAHNVQVYESIFGQINLEANQDKVRELQASGVIGQHPGMGDQQ